MSLHGKLGQGRRVGFICQVAFEESRVCLLQIENLEVSSIEGLTLNAHPLDDGIVYMELNRYWR